MKIHKPQSETVSISFKCYERPFVVKVLYGNEDQGHFLILLSCPLLPFSLVWTLGTDHTAAKSGQLSQETSSLSFLTLESWHPTNANMVASLQEAFKNYPRTGIWVGNFMIRKYTSLETQGSPLCSTLKVPAILRCGFTKRWKRGDLRPIQLNNPPRSPLPSWTQNVVVV